MADIDLLPPEILEERRRRRSRLLAAAVVVFMLGLPLYLSFRSYSLVRHYRHALAEAEAELASYQPHLARRDELVKAEKALKDKKDFIAGVTVSRPWSSVLATVNEAVPEGLSFTEVELSSNGKVTVKGRSQTLTAAANFIIALYRVPYVRMVLLEFPEAFGDPTEPWPLSFVATIETSR